jgi:PhnB protein
MTVSAIPDGFHAVTPYLVVEEAQDLIRFLKQAFNAVEEHRSTDQEGKVLHAQLKLGDSIVMLSDAHKDFGPMPGMLYLYVEDVDVVYHRALQAGGTSLQEPTDQFYGDRSGGVRDMCGNQWWIATRKEIVPPDELMRRQQALASSESSSRKAAPSAT